MTAHDPLLEVSAVSVQYRRGRSILSALSDVSFTVGAGESVGLVGESGSGKSTIARAVLGLAPLHSGVIKFSGGDVTHLRFKQRRDLYREIQMVFQDPYSSLNPARTVGGTLAEPLEAIGHFSKAEVRSRVYASLERVALPTEAASRYPQEFSGGQRQRIAIARALILAPRLVICDEAVSALDLSVQAQILNLLQDLQVESGLSYLFISHDLEVVQYLCERVVVLYKGQVMETGPVHEVTSNPAHPYTAALHEASPLPDPRAQRARQIAREAVPSEDTSVGGGATPAACPFAPRCPHVRPRCRTERPQLRRAERDALVACHQYPEWREEVRPAKSSSAEEEKHLADAS